MVNTNIFFVSIICPTYNQSSYIIDAMNGFAMQQTNFPFLAVIVDDASTDGEQEVIKSYIEEHFDHSERSGYNKWETEDAFWIFARHKVNENCHFVAVFLTRNLYKEPEKKETVIKEWTNTKYIALCEGDDYWTDPLKLQKQVDFLETHLGFSMCFHGAMVKNETDTKQLTTCDQVEEKEYLTNDIFPGWVIPTASVIYRKSMIDKYPPLRHIEWRKYGDIELFLKCTHTGKVWGMSEFMSVYRMTDNGAVVSQNRDPMTQYKLIFHYRFLMENFPRLDKRWPKAFISTYYYTQFRSSIGIGEKLKAVAIAFYYSPKYVIQKLLKKHPRGTY